MEQTVKRTGAKGSNLQEETIHKGGPMMDIAIWYAESVILFLLVLVGLCPGKD